MGMCRRVQACADMCMCMHMCMLHVHVHVHVQARAGMCRHVHMHVQTCDMRMHMHMRMRVHMPMHLCMRDVAGRGTRGATGVHARDASAVHARRTVAGRACLRRVVRGHARLEEQRLDLRVEALHVRLLLVVGERVHRGVVLLLPLYDGGVGHLHGRNH